MQILHLLSKDQLTKNSSIYEELIEISAWLESHHHIQSWLVYPDIVTLTESVPFKLIPVPKTAFKKNRFSPLNFRPLGFIHEMRNNYGLSPKNTLVVSHGGFEFPTRWGSMLKDMGFAWICLPHGYFHPKHQSRKGFAKKYYWTAIEHPFSLKADKIWCDHRDEYEALLSPVSGTQIKLIPDNNNPEKRIEDRASIYLEWKL